MTRFIALTALSLLASLSAVHAQDHGRSDIRKIEGDRMYVTCRSLECFGKQSIKEAYYAGQIDSVVLADRSECDYLNFAKANPIPCVAKQD